MTEQKILRCAPDSATSLYYCCSKEFLVAGKKQLAGDAARQSSSPEVKVLRAEEGLGKCHP